MTEKRNETLIRELYREMEEELERDPAEMDTQKIKQINLLLARLERREKLPPDMEPEKFLERFDKKYDLDLSSAWKASQRPGPAYSVKRISWKAKAITAAAAIALLASIADRISTVAMDQSLWWKMKETAHGIYFGTLGVGKDAEEQIREHYESYTDWEALKGSLEHPILTPEYIPEGLVLKELEKNVFENSVNLSAYYKGEDAYLSIFSEYYMIPGVGLKGSGEDTDEGEYREIGGRNVHVRIGDGIHMIFAEYGVLYSLDTTLGLEEAERVIENLK